MKTQLTPENSERMRTISLLLTPLAVIIVVVGLSSCSTPSTQDVSTNANAPQTTAGNKEGTKTPPKNTGGALMIWAGSLGGQIRHTEVRGERVIFSTLA